MAEEKQRFVIIDGNAIIHRAYHALPPMTVKDGTIVNAVFGFTSMLLKVVDDLKPSYLAVSFDVEGGTFRDQIYSGYKATRVKADQDLYDQIPFCYEVAEAFNIPIYTKKGYEADDIIGTIAKSEEVKEKKDFEVIIITGDADMLQLVDNHVKVYKPTKGISEPRLYGVKEVKEKYGFDPEMIVDYKALRGDASDNIPGVRGVGEKTAAALITKIGGIGDIYKAIRDKSPKIIGQFRESVIKKLKEGEKDAKMSYRLAKIDISVKGLGFKISDCRFRADDLNPDKISDLLKKFEFFSLLKRIPGSTEVGKVGGRRRMSKLIKGRGVIIVSSENFLNFIKILENEKQFVCREILSGKHVLSGDLLGFVFGARKNSYYIDWKKNADGNKKKILRVFEDERKILIGHDLKRLVKFLLLKNIEVKNKLFDVMVASYVVNSSTRSHDLKSLVMRELGKELSGLGGQESLFGIDPEIAAKESGLIFELYKKFTKDLRDNDDLGLFEKMEMRLVPVLADMELNGVAVDTNLLADLSKEVNKAVGKVVKNIHKRAGVEFNVASSVQLREILFEKMRLPTEGIKKGKTGYSTAASELEKLRGIDPIIAMIEEYRELEKLRNTYIDVLPALVNVKTGRIHTSFNQAVTTTGRLSSSDPNLQNIPIRTKLGREIRKAFVAERGYSLVTADYSQIELRIAASLARDKKMMEIFEKGEDIHKATAAAINGVRLDEVTKEMRYGAKEVNFGVLYGMGSYGLSWRAGIPRWRAKEFIDRYFEEFSGVKEYIDQTLKFARENGYVETLLGRRRYIPELRSDNHQLRAAGERMAINMPIQGTAADLIKLAMIALRDKMRELKYAKDQVKLILQVHDELVWEVKNGMEDEISDIVKKIMEDTARLRVPVEVKVSSGKRWGEIK